MCAEVTTAEPEWIALLRTERARGKSIAEIAREIGMPRPALKKSPRNSRPLFSCGTARKWPAHIWVAA